MMGPCVASMRRTTTKRIPKPRYASSTRLTTFAGVALVLCLQSAVYSQTIEYVDDDARAVRSSDTDPATSSLPKIVAVGSLISIPAGIETKRQYHGTRTAMGRTTASGEDGFELIYSNTIDPIASILSPGDAAAGFWVADDISTTAVGGGTLVAYEINTFAAAGSGAYDVTTELWNGDPCNNGSNPIAGTAIGFVGVPDGSLFLLIGTFPGYAPIPQHLFMKVTFSSDSASWVIAETAESGFSDNFFSANIDTTGNGFPDTCNLRWFGGVP